MRCLICKKNIKDTLLRFHKMQHYNEIYFTHDKHNQPGLLIDIKTAAMILSQCKLELGNHGGYLPITDKNRK